MKLHKIFVNDFDLDAEGHTAATIFFNLNGKRFDAFGEFAENIQYKWIEVQLSFSCDYRITMNEMLSKNNRKEKRIVDAPWFCGYYVYCQIVSIKPMIIDCGSIILEVDLEMSKELEIFNSSEYLNRFIYFEIVRLDVDDYKILD